MIDSINAYWWNDAPYPNLGDEITRLILEHIFRLKVDWAPPRTAHILGAGSTLGWIRPNAEKTAPRHLHVVGAGFMYADERFIPTKSVKIHSVRGYLSSKKLEPDVVGAVKLGDPGLLADRFLEITNTQELESCKIGLIPHHTNVTNEKFFEPFRGLDYRVLDIRTDDIADFMSRLSACEMVVSQSLHGLIFADAIGIPNVWLRMTNRSSPRDFKFFDYFSSVGRDFETYLEHRPTSIGGVEALCNLVQRTRLVSLQEQVLESFEDALRSLRARCDVSEQRNRLLMEDKFRAIRRRVAGLPGIRRWYQLSQ